MLIIFAVLCLAYTFVEASSDYVLTKPFIATFQVAASELKVSNVDCQVGYNVTTSRYDFVLAGVTNVGQLAAFGRLTVEFFDVYSVVVASGMEELNPLNANSTIIVKVFIVWKTEKTVLDVAHVKVTVS